MRFPLDRAQDDAFQTALKAISRLPTAVAQLQVVETLAVQVATNATRDAFAESGIRVESPIAGLITDAPELSDQLQSIFEDRRIDTKANQVLVTAGLLQKRNGNRSLTAREIHEPLRRAGYDMGNISAHLNGIIYRHGKAQITKTADRNRHRQYWVTATGMKAAGLMLED